MFLAAVDLGRFLSDVVIKFYAKAEQAQKKLANLCGFPKKNAVISLETTALKVLTPIKRRSINRFAKKTRKSKKKESNKKRLPLAVNGLIILLFCMFGGVSTQNIINIFLVSRLYTQQPEATKKTSSGHSSSLSIWWLTWPWARCRATYLKYWRLSI